MKKRFFYIIPLVLLVAACSKDKPSPVFGERPDDRLEKTLTEYKTQLTSAPDGWKGIIYPKGGGGFSFYFQFGQDDRVTMLSDIDAEKAGTPASSTYRLKAQQRPTLLFDTYSYLHLPADPNPGILNGETGKGWTSDFEFAYAEVKDDTIRFRGILNGNDFILVRATAAEKQAYGAGRLGQLMEATQEYTRENPFLHIQAGDGPKMQVKISAGSKTVAFVYLNGQETVMESIPFVFTLKGIELKTPVQYGNGQFSELLWDEAKQLYYIMLGTQRVELQSSNTPIIPLHLMLGYNKFYTAIVYDPSALPSLSRPFDNIYAAAANGMRTDSSLTLQYAAIIYNGPDEVVLDLYYTDEAGNGFNGYYFCAWVTDDTGRQRLSPQTANNEGITLLNRISGIGDLVFYFDDTFRSDWITGLPVQGDVGRLYLTSNPNSFFYGFLY